jgi:hypothetical protein
MSRDRGAVDAVVGRELGDRGTFAVLVDEVVDLGGAEASLGGV